MQSPSAPHRPWFSALLFVMPFLATGTAAQVPSQRAIEMADETLERYGEPALDTLGKLIAHDTFARPGISNAEHPSFRAMTADLERIAAEFGLDFADHGAVVVIGLGQGADRLGIVTHGDVQPADATKWAANPFSLDRTSEPGRLVGRGVEDDKGPIVCALYAMRSIRERRLSLKRRIELIISYTEESDWTPFQEFLAENPPPALNVALDAEYPVVVAEKGWCSITVRIPATAPEADGEPTLAAFTGGFFLSQVPEDARATVRHPTPELEARLMAVARQSSDVRFSFEPEAQHLTIRARGLAAHSSKPETGRNAITHLAALLGTWHWPKSAPSLTVDFINDLVGTGFYGERFGELAYADAFMGPLTLSLGTLTEEEGELVAGINVRRPQGRSKEQVERALERALEAWKKERNCPGLTFSAYIGEPHAPQSPAHVPLLIETFRYYSGASDAKPLSIGGGTHARLLPAGVNFGPAMPGEVYTGHSEHEYMSRAQFLLNLRMYTSLLVDLAAD